MKQIPVHDLIEGKKLLFVDDSIVRGTQLRETVEFLYANGAKEVHIRSACPPIMYGCKFLNFSTSRSPMELLARRTVYELEGEEGDKRVDYHNKAKDYAEDVQHEREIVIAAAAGETDEGQTGQPGDAVGDEPDGEEHHECPGPGGGVEQYHQAGEYAQNAARERETGAEARALLELDVKHYVYDARDEGQDAV